MTASAPIDPAVRVGHVHLKVADLDRSVAFYRDALGFGVFADGRPLLRNEPLDVDTPTFKSVADRT